MPNIPEFTAQADLTPSDKGIQAAEVAGRRIGMYGHQLEGDADQIGAKLQQHEDDMWMSNYYAASTTADANLRTGWDQFVADPQNKGLIASGTAASVYMDKVVKPTLSQLAGSAKTPNQQRMAAEQTGRMQSNLFDRIHGEQSVLTGQVFQQNYLQTQNNFASAVIDDPSDTNVREQLAQNEMFTKGLPAGVEGENRAHMLELQAVGDQRIAYAAYMGQIEKVKQQYAAGGSSPAEADVREKVAGQKYFEYLSPEQQTDVGTRLDEAVHTGQDMFKTAQAADKVQTVEQTKAQIAGLRASLLPDANGQPPDPRNAAAALDKLHTLMTSKDPVVAATAGEEAGALTNMITTQAEDRLTGKLTVDDPSAVAEINTRKSIPPDQPGALTKVQLDDMRSAHKISDTTYAEQIRRLDDMTSNPALRQNEERLISWLHTTVAPLLTDDPNAGTYTPGQPINLSASTVDPNGKAAFGLATNQVVAEYEDLVAGGKMTPDQAYAAVTNPEAIQKAMPTWAAYKTNGFAWASQHPAEYGIMTGQKLAVPAAEGLDDRVAKVQAAGPIKAGESWTTYKARAGIN